jgi:hypothetical protein
MYGVKTPDDVRGGGQVPQEKPDDPEEQKFILSPPRALMQLISLLTLSLPHSGQGGYFSLSPANINCSKQWPHCLH